MTDPNEPVLPTGFTEVTEGEFFERLKADKRDIMPTTEAHFHTPWRVVATREMWGWASKGWQSKHGTPERFAIASQYMGKAS